MLINAPHDKEFVFHDGSRAKNLLELVSKIDFLSDHEFHQFVNHHKNDFANWTEHVLNDKHFADKLRGILSKHETTRAIRDRINKSTFGDSIIKIPKTEKEEVKEHVEHVHEHHESHHEHHQSGPIYVEHHVEHHVESSKAEEDNKNKDNKDSKDVVAKESKLKHKLINLFTKKPSEKKPEKLPDVEHKPEIKPEHKPEPVLEHKQEHKPEIKPEHKPEHKSEPKHVHTVHTTHKEEDHSELIDEAEQEKRENALWVILYIALVLLVITLLVYKLFL